MTWLGGFALVMMGAFLGTVTVVWIVLRSNENTKELEKRVLEYAGKAAGNEVLLKDLLQECRELGYDFTYDEKTNNWTRKRIGEPTTPESSET